MQMFINDNHNMEIAVIFTKIPHDTGIVLGTKGTANINFLTELRTGTQLYWWVFLPVSKEVHYFSSVVNNPFSNGIGYDSFNELFLN